MRIGTPGFVPDRLIQVRKARRIATKSALARFLGVNPSTVIRWEDGTYAPDAEALTLLAGALNVRREFFLRPVYDSSKPMFHRSLASTLNRDLDYQHSQMEWMHEISATLQHYVDFPKIDIPDVLGGLDYKQLRDEDIERIALDLRRHWNLGEGPCPDLVPLLERIGIIVSVIEMGTSKLDGLCSWSDTENRPHILLATDKMSFPRRQMDAAHELAHAILHANVSKEELKKNLKFIESQAFRLGGALLLPSTTFPYEVKRPSLAALLALKERWRVSVKAQIRRLLDLEVITEDHSIDLYKLYSAKGWSREEPLDQAWEMTDPRIMADAINLVVNAGIRTKSDLRNVEFTMSSGDVENITGLPPGWFSERAGELVRLTINSQRNNESHNVEGVVVPFTLNRK